MQSLLHLAAPSDSPFTVLLTVSFQDAFSLPCQNLLMGLAARPVRLLLDRLSIGAESEQRLLER